VIFTDVLFSRSGCRQNAWCRGPIIDEVLHKEGEGRAAEIDEGTFFSYRDRSTGEWRLGYYERFTDRFTPLNEDGDTIVTHFRCGERYVRGLPENDYR